MDLHIFCKIPTEPKFRDKAVIYFDDFSLQAFIDPPVSIDTPLEEYYAGESIPWTVTGFSMEPLSTVKVSLQNGGRIVLIGSNNTILSKARGRCFYECGQKGDAQYVDSSHPTILASSKERDVACCDSYLKTPQKIISYVM